ncbi:hypothetical protein EXIGLDRAFT_829721 [Exidia glandulosa HHB12029]|uniref:Uncharacterized protein n=1 Tax=Exidia glandulosa HHB12029 TaxID=1314781 RepID=A0A165P890_EXIGL|nr:hypothetical protein EXIGLDRAFT_829721 [Exidia glandulosa HHB12029]
MSVYDQGTERVSGQQQLPRKVEKDFGAKNTEGGPTLMSGTDKSHATGDSIVPQKMQEVVPEFLERALPNAIHDTSGAAPQKEKSFFRQP